MILDNRELEFYKWDGELSQLLQNVRDKLNKVAEVKFSWICCRVFFPCIPSQILTVNLMPNTYYVHL